MLYVELDILYIRSEMLYKTIIHQSVDPGTKVLDNILDY